VSFEAVDERSCPELAEKRELWDEPPQRRGGVVLSVDEVILGLEHYVIGLDEPLNVDHREISDRLCEKFFGAASCVKSPKRHIIIVRAIAVMRGSVSFVVSSNISIPVTVLEDFPHRIYRCYTCSVAQKAHNMLLTCEAYGHMVCKKDIIPWDDRKNKPLLSKCAQFTEEMKSYCHSTMGYEPTYIPTRVLLGHSYWVREDKLKAVQEFCEYDLWVCSVCRFCRDGSARNKSNQTVKFGFIHAQLFPEGAEEIADKIMTSTDRDELAQFGRNDSRIDASPGGEAVSGNADDKFLQLHSDMIIHVLDPSSRSVHRIPCFKNWNLSNILREILKVSQIAYNADIVIYKLDQDGWEVELCDLLLVDLEDPSSSSSKKTPNVPSDMVSIHDLESQDILVIRMRSLHKIGARSRLPGLGISDPSIGKEIGKIAEIYGGFRRIGGDGNCYYRAIAYGALEAIVLSGDCSKFDLLYSIFMQVEYVVVGDQEAHEELLTTLREASNGDKWGSVEELQSTFLSLNSNFDFALVSACRHLLSTYLIENQDKMTDGGLSLKDALVEGDEGMDLVAYCEKHINEMGRDAEGPYIELGILPSLLRCKCVIYSLDMRHMSEKEYVCPFTTKEDVEPLAVIHVLLRPGHYDLLYTPIVTFPAPPVFQDVEDREAAIVLQRAEEKLSSRDSGAPRYDDEENSIKGDDSAKMLPSVTDTDGPESNSPLVAARKDNRLKSKRSESKSGSDSSRRVSSTVRAQALSEMLDMFPDVPQENALRLLERYEFNVEIAINAYLTGGSDGDGNYGGGSSDEKGERDERSDTVEMAADDVGQMKDDDTQRSSWFPSFGRTFGRK
jgi:hypothetical protein